MAGGELDALTRAVTAIVNEARAHVAAGREPNAAALEARVRAAAQRERPGQDDEQAAAIDRAERAGLKQLERVVAVQRARAALTREPPQRPAAAAPTLPRRRGALRTRPTITGNMDVRKREEAGAVTISWDAVPAVASWEVRFSEQPARSRGDYVVRETVTLPDGTTAVELPLGERPLRVNLLGRGRDGRLVRRAMISALTRESWSERWERRATAS